MTVPVGELTKRIEAAQRQLHAQQLDGMLISSPVNLGYFAGFRTPFLVSFTRPYFAIIPTVGEPVGVVPVLAARLFKELSGFSKIETWPSPSPKDEGLSILSAEIARLPRMHGRFGAELGAGTRLGMPTSDFLSLGQTLAAQTTFVDCSQLVNLLRHIKSDYEISCLAAVCETASAIYDEVPSFLTRGMTPREACSRFASRAYELGVEDVPFLAAESGPGGYRTAIAAPSDTPLQDGDILVIDTGLRKHGYFCDFNRNWAISSHDEKVQAAYRIVFKATEIGLNTVRIGTTLGEVWAAMAAELSNHGSLSPGSRMGHGLGLELTEEPSIANKSEVIIQPGMVLTIEPGMVYGEGKVMLHEEVIAVSESGCTLLTKRAAPEIPVVN